MDRTELGVFLDDWGNLIGAGLVLAPMMWDVVGTGIRGFFEWNIGVWGIISQLLGIGFILLTKVMRRYW